MSALLLFVGVGLVQYGLGFAVGWMYRDTQALIEADREMEQA